MTPPKRKPTNKRCCCSGCDHYHFQRSDLRFFEVPYHDGKTSKARRVAWLKAINRTNRQNGHQLWSPEKRGSFVCSLHFEGGKNRQNTYSCVPNYGGGELNEFWIFTAEFPNSKKHFFLVKKCLKKLGYNCFKLEYTFYFL